MPSVRSQLKHFYRAMHFGAKRRIEIACRPSVRPSVRNVGGSGPHRYIGNLGSSDIDTCTNNLSNPFALRSPKAIHYYRAAWCSG